MMTVKYFCLLFVVLASAQRIRYDNYQLQRLFLDNEIQRQAVEKLTSHSEGVILYNNVKSSVGSHVDLIVSPQILPELDHIVRIFRIRRSIIVENVEKEIERQQLSADSTRFDWTNYQDFNEISIWMDSLELQYPNIVKLVTIGTSYEGRPLRGVIISFKEHNPGVFLESGIHADEWIGPASATWIVNELLTSKDANVRFIAENFDWYIFPTVNPDGYQYSHTTERFWRKTRSQGNGSCIGVDPNRNWDFHWLEGGASSDPCSGSYGGPEPFSEVETRFLAEYLTSLKEKIQVYLSFHCYGQMLMFPYGYTFDHVKDYDTLLEIGTKSAEALASRFGTQYVVGDIAETIYVASGSSLDWVYENLNTSYTYVYELRDVGLLPPEEIIPTAQETLDSIIVILNESRAKHLK